MHHETHAQRLTAFLAVALSVLLAVPAGATLLVYKDLNALVNESSGVVVGTVRLVTGERSPEGEIFTFVLLDDLEVLDGDYQGSELVLRQRGGEVDGHFEHLDGAPRFVAGERVLVFVEDNGQRMVPVTGWDQGVFRARLEPSRGEEIVTDHAGNRVLEIRGDTILRENRFESEAQVVGNELAGAGSTDDGSASHLVVATSATGRTIHGQGQGVAAEALTFARFVSTVRSRAAAARKPQQTLRSLDVRDFSNTAAERADASDGVTPPSAAEPDATPVTPQPTVPERHPEDASNE